MFKEDTLKDYYTTIKTHVARFKDNYRSLWRNVGEESRLSVTRIGAGLDIISYCYIVISVS